MELKKIYLAGIIWYHIIKTKKKKKRHWSSARRSAKQKKKWWMNDQQLRRVPQHGRHDLSVKVHVANIYLWSLLTSARTRKPVTFIRGTVVCCKHPKIYINHFRQFIFLFNNSFLQIKSFQKESFSLDVDVMFEYMFYLTFNICIFTWSISNTCLLI